MPSLYLILVIKLAYGRKKKKEREIERYNMKKKKCSFTIKYYLKRYFIKTIFKNSNFILKNDVMIKYT